MSPSHGRSFHSSLVVLFAVMFFVLLAPTALAAQEKTDTVRVEVPEQMEAQMAMMGPMMGQMMQAMMEGLLAILAKPETAERIATFTKNYFDALVAKGFTKEEALRIVMAHGIPSMPTGQ
jgi:alkanesulfonate monooxygenase SsuD/methylene tetrahydromethanopterin reductase-like flavin-dependent oxidoreductase (luciferase family)